MHRKAQENKVKVETTNTVAAETSCEKQDRLVSNAIETATLHAKAGTDLARVAGELGYAAESHEILERAQTLVSAEASHILPEQLTSTIEGAQKRDVSWAGAGAHNLDKHHASSVGCAERFLVWKPSTMTSCFSKGTRERKLLSLLRDLAGFSWRSSIYNWRQLCLNNFIWIVTTVVKIRIKN